MTARVQIWPGQWANIERERLLGVWIKLAKDEWVCIRAQLSADEKSWSMIGFHANYAVVRLLNALLAKNDNVSGTDSIIPLFQECPRFDTTLRRMKPDIDYLSEFDERLLYPSPYDDVDEKRILNAVAASERVCKAVRSSVGLSESQILI
jgi:hypothetical protein